VKKSLLGLFGLLGLVSVLATSGCGGDSNSSTSDAVTSCNAYCDAYFAVTPACADPAFPSAAQCKTDECTPPPGVTAACTSAAKTYYDCRKAQADLCADTGCDSQLAALATACT
jgi:hypothetical protein